MFQPATQGTITCTASVRRDQYRGREHELVFPAKGRSGVQHARNPRSGRKQVSHQYSSTVSQESTSEIPSGTDTSISRAWSLSASTNFLEAYRHVPLSVTSGCRQLVNLESSPVEDQGVDILEMIQMKEIGTVTPPDGRD
ncbi:hypothetical protein RRG08_052072 [Elysia crispata]|uniref:Uncharacterized protein n=1 Tax=Elysia crispata TaxID=231223 RepID=A0AAE1DS15_9GAST|nr:hypothetical protein RRG08_052072 [Elysia crispata]